MEKAMVFMEKAMKYMAEMVVSCVLVRNNSKLQDLLVNLNSNYEWTCSSSWQLSLVAEEDRTIAVKMTSCHALKIQNKGLSLVSLRLIRISISR